MCCRVVVICALSLSDLQAADKFMSLCAQCMFVLTTSCQVNRVDLTAVSMRSARVLLQIRNVGIGMSKCVVVVYGPIPPTTTKLVLLCVCVFFSCYASDVASYNTDTLSRCSRAVTRHLADGYKQVAISSIRTFLRRKLNACSIGRAI